MMVGRGFWQKMTDDARDFGICHKNRGRGFYKMMMDDNGRVGVFAKR